MPLKGKAGCVYLDESLVSQIKYEDFVVESAPACPVLADPKMHALLKVISRLSQICKTATQAMHRIALEYHYVASLLK